MSRLNLLVRCLVLAALCLLPACMVTSSQPTASSSPAPGRQQAPAIVRLTLWHSWSGAKLDALNNLARSYEQNHPDVRISLIAQPATDMLRAYGLSVADGSAPQILLLLGRYVGDLAERKYIAPLDDALSEDDLAALLPQAVDSGRVNGQLYAIPISFDMLTLFYDRRQITAPPETFEQVLNLNAAHGEQPPEQRPLSLGYYLSLETTLPYLDAFGGALFSQQGEPVFAQQGRDATIRWLDWLKSLQANQNTIVSANFSAVDAAIQQGRVLSAIDWTRRRAVYAQIWGPDSVGIVSLPRLGAEATPRPLVLPEVLAINTVVSPEQRAVAQDFVRYMLERSSQETLWSRGQMLPVHRDVSVSEEMQPVLAAAAGSQPFTNRLAATSVWRPLNDMLRSVLTNAVAANEAIDSAGAALQTSTP
jgi:arabinogalactan oligomer / maltooligosaccharide transport system substrate-binding protein